MENKLDKFFKDKLDQRTFDLQEEHWAKMEAMIEAEEKEGNRKWLFGWLLFGLFLLSGVVYLITANSDLSPSENEMQTTSNAISNNQNTIRTKTVEMDDELLSPVVESPIENAITKRDASETKEVENLITKNEILNKNNVSQKNGDENSNSKVSNSAHKKNNKIESQQNIYIDDFSTKKNPTDPRDEIIVLKNVFEKNKKPTEIQEEKTIENSNSTIPDPLKEKQESTSSTINKEATPSKKPIAKALLSIPSLDQFSIFSNNKENDLPDLEWMKIKKKSRFSLGLTAGIVSFPLEENSTNSILGSKVGLTLKYQLKRKLALNADLMYFYRGGKYAPTQSESVVHYSFGRLVDQLELTPENLHYFELPIYATYPIGKFNLEGGLSANVLLGVRGKTQRVPQEGQAFALDDPHWIDNSGFKDTFANVLLGVRYQVSPTLHFGLRGNYTLGGFKTDPQTELNYRSDLKNESPLHITFKLTQYLF